MLEQFTIRTVSHQNRLLLGQYYVMIAYFSKNKINKLRFVNDVESKIRRSEEVENPKDLATCNRLLLDQQRLEDQERLKNPSIVHKSRDIVT